MVLAHFSCLRRMVYCSVKKHSVSVSAAMSKPRPLVVCGPSGAGKSTIVAKLFQEFPAAFGFSVSHTTRAPRDGERHGVHYFFVERQAMLEAIQRGEFIEHAEFAANLYGTSHQAVRTVQDSGRICVLDIEIQGVKQIKATDLKPLFVFIRPPDMSELEKRLRGRLTETEESIQRRLQTALEELEYSQQPDSFDKIIVNDSLEAAVQQLREFMLPFIAQLPPPPDQHVLSDSRNE